MKRKILKVIIGSLCISAGILGLSLIIKGLYDDYLEKNGTKAIVTKDFDYQVVFEPNNFYSEIDPNAESYFPSKLVDALNINLYYKNEGIIPQKYDYRITTTLIGQMADDHGIQETIWHKEYNIETEEGVIPNQDSWEIIKPLTIDYKYYEAIVKDYKMTYNLKINATLIINLDIIGYIDNNDIKDSLQLAIPIDENITTIRAEFDKTSPLYYPQEKKHNVEYYLYSLILVVIPTLYGIIILKRKRASNINHRLKEYRDLIIPIKDNLSIATMPFIDVATIDNIIAVALENTTNIIYFRTPSQSYFYVITEYVIYRFIAQEK